MNYRIITTGNALSDYIDELRRSGVGTVALDLEGEFNLHQYGEKLCLIQLYDGTDAVAVDPFGIDGAMLRRLFEEQSLLKVMYDSLSDQALVQKCYGFGIKSIFDLRPAAELLKLERKDLGSVLQYALGVTIEKKKKFQRYNWTRRPIDRDAIEYALSDVFHLLSLKDALLSRLSEAHLADEFMLANERLQDRDFLSDRTPRIFKSNQFQRLPRGAKRRFEQIYEARDGHARKLNVPPDIVLNKQQMFALATGQLTPGRLDLNRRIPNSTRSALAEQLAAIVSDERR